MPKPTLKTPQLIQRMIALHAEGASAREIAEELGLAHGTIQTWLRDAGLQPNGGNGSRAHRKRSPPDPKQVQLAELEIPTPSTDIPSMLVGLHEELAEQRAMMRRIREATKDGAGNMIALDKAQLICERLATKIVQLTPQAPADPEQDPANVEAAQETRERFRMLVEAAERQKMNGGHR